MVIYSSIANILKMFLFPILACGFITNTISFLVMKRIKNSSTAKYMSFLALVDSGVLLAGGLSICLHSINYDSFYLISFLACKFIPFSFYSLADYSVLLIVSMTGERFYGVWKPFSWNKISKDRLIRLNLIFGCLFCCLLNSHFLFTHSLVDQVNDTSNVSFKGKYQTDSFNSNKADYVCEYVYLKDFYDHYWVYIDASIYSFIPSFLIFTLNILIIRMLNKADKINSNLSQKYQSDTKANKDNSRKSLFLHRDPTCRAREIRSKSLTCFYNKKTKNLYVNHQHHSLVNFI